MAEQVKIKASSWLTYRVWNIYATNLNGRWQKVNKQPYTSRQQAEEAAAILLPSFELVEG